ncbi:MAG: type III pantothenate kinase [Planctomycetia bacterium]|nr:type III pantothenate kinase [Planctomycetia bacterium]
MTTSSTLPLVAVDVGNSRVKLGLFTEVDGKPLPQPVRTLDIGPDAAQFAQVATWLADVPVSQPPWWISSVERRVAGQLIGWLRDQGTNEIMMLSAPDLPLAVTVARPDKVGIDRLVDAVAANRLRPAGEPAIIVDLGSAITVDLLSADGAFLGGAILPGIGTAARAMHQFTDLLPLVDMATLDAPPAPLGTATAEAMRSGLFWGAVGGIRELIERLSVGQATKPRVFLTGGAAPSVAPLLSEHAEYVPHLTLAGIALTAAHQAAS